jgi:hypothetical protein
MLNKIMAFILFFIVSFYQFFQEKREKEVFYIVILQCVLEVGMVIPYLTANCRLYLIGAEWES